MIDSTEVMKLRSENSRLQVELAESERIRAIKQRRIVGLENSLADARGDKAYRKKSVIVDGVLERPHEQDPG